MGLCCADGCFGMDLCRQQKARVPKAGLSSACASQFVGRERIMPVRKSIHAGEHGGGLRSSPQVGGSWHMVFVRQGATGWRWHVRSPSSAAVGRLSPLASTCGVGDRPCKNQRLVEVMLPRVSHSEQSRLGFGHFAGRARSVEYSTDHYPGPGKVGTPAVILACRSPRLSTRCLENSKPLPGTRCS